MKQISARIALTTFALVLATPLVVLAAGSHDHSPKFGGIVAEGKAFDAELVATPDLITLHVFDHGKPMSTKGAKGKVTLLTGADKAEIELLPSGASSMEAKGKFNVSKGTKAVAEITLEGKKPRSVRFVLK